MDRIDGVHFIQMYGGNYMSHIVCDNGLPVLGIYPLTNTGSLVIHSMDDEQVQVSLNPVSASARLSWMMMVNMTWSMVFSGERCWYPLTMSCVFDYN